MNRLNDLFKVKNSQILSIYFTAGFPSLNDTVEIISELHANNVDMIEIGIPFSDPLADGPIIQNSSEIALINGMTVKHLFEQLARAELRKMTTTSVLLMGYLNPVLQYGVEKFCQHASELGIDGVIIPDLPLQEYLNEYESIFKKYKLKNIFLITPQTSESRIRLIDQHTDGFIYMVSSSSTTGITKAGASEQDPYFKRIQEMKLKNPILIGFGISDFKTFEKACRFANGVIVGSAFVKAAANSLNLKKDIADFVKMITSIN